MQLAVLSGYSATVVRASAVAAVHRVLATTPWDVPLSLCWIVFLSPRLPQSVSETAGDLLNWLSRSATWCGTLYASGHIPHAGRCTTFRADWSHDLLVLRGLVSALSLHPSVDWGVNRSVHRRKGAPAD